MCKGLGSGDQSWNKCSLSYILEVYSEERKGVDPEKKCHGLTYLELALWSVIHYLNSYLNDLCLKTRSLQIMTAFT